MTGSRRRRKHPRAILAAAFSACIPSAALAGTSNWTNTAGGNFNTPANWNSTAGPVPGASDIAQFNINNTYTTTFDSSPNNALLNVLQGTVSFRPDTVASRAYTVGSMSVSGGSLTLTAPASGTNTLNVALGANPVSVIGAQLSVAAGNDIT